MPHEPVKYGLRTIKVLHVLHANVTVHTTAPAPWPFANSFVYLAFYTKR